MTLQHDPVCWMCRRRSDGAAVPTTTAKNPTMRWICDACFEPAKRAARLPRAKFDVYENRAIEHVAELAAPHLGMPEQDVPAFLRWLIDEFGDRLRQECDHVPF